MQRFLQQDTNHVSDVNQIYHQNKWYKYSFKVQNGFQHIRTSELSCNKNSYVILFDLFLKLKNYCTNEHEVTFYRTCITENILAKC
jgi:hypothetical protein